MFSFFNLLFPPSCISCGRFGQPLCNACLSGLKKAPNLICPTCLKTHPQGQKHPKCKGNIDGLIFLFRYEKHLQTILKSIKYGFYYRSLTPLLNFYLENLELNSQFQQFLKTKPTLIPVPIHKKRYLTRGFNQSQIIAKYLSQAWNLPISNKIIQRTRNTSYQARLSKKQRVLNMKNTFSPTDKILKLSQKPLANENILLIDDVFTTGSTVKECVKVIKALGVKKNGFSP